MSENKIIGIIGLAIAVIYGFSITGIQNTGVTFLSGTRIFPIIIAIGTAVFSLIILLQDFKKGEESKKLKIKKKTLQTMGMFLLIFVIYTLIFERVGFILSTALMLFGLLSILNKGKLKTNILVSVLFPLAAYSIFAKIFAISLPNGILYF